MIRQQAREHGITIAPDVVASLAACIEGSMEDTEGRFVGFEIGPDAGTVRVMFKVDKTQP